MPVVPTKDAKLTQGAFNPRLKSIDAAGAAGRGANQLGLQLSAIVERKQKLDGATQAAEIYAKIQKESEELFFQESDSAILLNTDGTTNLQSKNGGFQGAVNGGVDEIIRTNMSNVTNKHALEILNKNLPGLQTNYAIRGIKHESDIITQHRQTVFKDVTQNISQTVYDDPSQFDSSLRLMEDTIKGMGLPQSEIDTLAKTERNNMALSAALGMVRQDATAAEEMLKDETSPIRQQLTVAQIERLNGMVSAAKKTNDSALKKHMNFRREDYISSLRAGGPRIEEFEESYLSAFVEDPGTMEDFMSNVVVYSELGQVLTQLPYLSNDQLTAITHSKDVVGFSSQTSELNAAIKVMAAEAKAELTARKDPAAYVQQHNEILAGKQGQDYYDTLINLQEGIGITNPRLLTDQQVDGLGLALQQAQVNPQRFQQAIVEIVGDTEETSTAIEKMREVINGTRGLNPIYEALVMPVLNGSKAAITLANAINNQDELNKEYKPTDVEDAVLDVFEEYGGAYVYGSPERIRTMSAQKEAVTLMTKQFMSQGDDVGVAAEKAFDIYVNETYYPMEDFPLIVPRQINGQPIDYTELRLSFDNYKEMIADQRVSIDFASSFGPNFEVMLDEFGELNSEGRTMINTLVPKLSEDGSTFILVQSNSPQLLPLVTMDENGQLQPMEFDTLEIMNMYDTQLQELKEILNQKGLEMPTPTQGLMQGVRN